MKQNIINTAEALLLATAMSSANAGSINPPVMDMTRQQVEAICSQDPNGLGLEIADGTKICEVSFDNGKTWILLSAAVVAGLALIWGWYILRSRRKKAKNEDIEELRSFSNLDFPVENPSIAESRKQSLMQSRMNLLWDVFQNFLNGSNVEKSLYTFDAQSTIVMDSSEHTEADKRQVQEWSEIIHSKSNKGEGEENEAEIGLKKEIGDKSVETSPSNPPDLIVDSGAEDTEKNPVQTFTQEESDSALAGLWEETPVPSSVNNIERDYSVGQTLLKGEQKNDFITNSLAGDCVRLANSGTLTKLADGRWEHKNGAKVRYFETNAKLIEDPICENERWRKNFTIDALGTVTDDSVKSSTPVTPTTETGDLSEKSEIVEIAQTWETHSSKTASLETLTEKFSKPNKRPSKKMPKHPNRKYWKEN